MKKGLVAVLILAMTCSMLAGCSKSDSGKSGDGKNAVTLNVVTTYAGDDGNAANFKNAVKDWEKDTGNKVNDASATSDETFKARVIADFETGAEPDVLFFFNGVDSNPFVESGKVVSIEEIRKEYPDYAGNMKDGMLGASPVDGKNYSVPVNGYWEGLYVNKTVLDACGIEVPGADYTWEQFLADCTTIKAKGYAPIAAALGNIPHYWFEFCIYNYLTPATHNILPETVDDVHGKAWVDGINDIKALYEAGYFPENTLSATDDETFEMFVQGKAAFLIDGSWKTGGIEKKFREDENSPIDEEQLKNFTVTYVPGKNDRKATDIIGGLSSGYYITKKAWDDPDKREAAVKFVMYMTSDEMVSKFAGVSATALKNGVSVDEDALSSLAKAGLDMVEGATGMAGAVQDQVPNECRVPVFDGMPKLVSGDTDAKDAVNECLGLLAEKNAK